MSKTYVTVMAQHNTNGSIVPLKLIWPDNRQFTIDRVIDVRMAAAMKAGGQGMRYRCRVLGKEVDLYCDEGQWFVET